MFDEIKAPDAGMHPPPIRERTLIVLQRFTEKPAPRCKRASVCNSTSTPTHTLAPIYAYPGDPDRAARDPRRYTPPPGQFER